MPDGPTPAPTDVLGGTPPAAPPTLDNAPLNTGRPGTPPPAPAAVGPTAPHPHAILGKAIKNFADALEGKRTVYTPDPTTGTYTETQVPRKPGGLFRDMVLGALSGGAAAATAPIRPGAGPIAGAAVGAQAALGQQQTMDSRAKNRAQEQAGPMKAAADQASQDQSQSNIAAAAVAQQTMNTLQIGHHIGLHDDGEVEAHNNASDVVKGEALKAGGQMAQVDNNGTPGNGPALMQAFNKDPKLMQAPDGFHRIPFVSYDTKDLTHKDGKWTEKDGSEPDWNKRATVNLVDLPNAAWNKQISVTRKTANDVAGSELSSGKPTDQQSITFGNLFSLGLKNTARMNADRTERERGPQDEKEAESWVSQAEGADKESPDYDLIQKRAAKGQSFLDAKSGTSLAGKAPSATAIKLQTEQLNKSLADYAAGKGPNLSDADRGTLVQRQKEEAIKGVPADIVAAIGVKPVPAQFDKGESDPEYRALSKAWGQASLDKKSALAAASGLARYQLMLEGKEFNVTNTSDQTMDLDPSHPGTNTLQPGEMGRANAAQLRKMPASLVMNTQDGTKVMAKQAAIRDIQTNVDNLRDKFSALDTLDAATRAKLIFALRDPDPGSAIHNLSVSEAKALADPKVADLVIAMQQMAENVMVARAVQGIGGAGSDSMRRALMNLVPDATTPSKAYAGKQLDAFQRTLNQLKTGVPTTGGGRGKLEPVAAGRNASTTPTASPKPDTHVFNLGAWKKANPTGDANAAKAYAQKQGFTVQE